MNNTTLQKILQIWLKPVLVCVLGLILIVRPGSLAAIAATAIGFLIAAVGAWKLISFFFNSRQDPMQLVIGIILLVIGFGVIRNPIRLERDLIRLVGVLVLLIGIRGSAAALSQRGKTISSACWILGAVLMLIPVTASRIVTIVLGVVILVVGIGMLLDAQKSNAPGPDDIIDAL